MKIQIKFKDADAISEMMRGAHPRSERKQDEFLDKYFEFGDYGRIEIDTKTMAARLLPRAEWLT